MASSEKFQHDQNPPSSGLTRRQFLPLLGATAALCPPLSSAFIGPRKGRPTRQARFVYVGTYTFPGVPPGGYPSQYCSRHLCVQDWIRTMVR